MHGALQQYNSRSISMKHIMMCFIIVPHFEESCQHDMIRILVGFVSTCQMIRDRKDAEEFQIY